MDKKQINKLIHIFDKQTELKESGIGKSGKFIMKTGKSVTKVRFTV